MNSTMICTCFFITYFFLSSNIFARDYIVIQSTTSTENSGLLDILEKEFEKDFNFDIRTVAVGTGQAIKNAINGDGDLLLIHSKKDEKNFVNQGYGVKRFELMYNDYVIVGPLNDPAGIMHAGNINEVLQMIQITKSLFLSRDDNSGTNMKEKNLWKSANIHIDDHSKWYLKNGQGMGATLNMASEISAYTISDRGTWLSFNNKDNMKILFEKDKKLFNPYGIIALNPKVFPHVEFEKSMIFIKWLLSEKGASIINSFKINDQQLFFTN